jgi:hypothetical protein
MLTGFAFPPLICSERFPENRRKLEGEGSSWGLGDEAVASWAASSQRKHNQGGGASNPPALPVYGDGSSLPWDGKPLAVGLDMDGMDGGSGFPVHALASSP